MLKAIDPATGLKGGEVGNTALASSVFSDLTRNDWRVQLLAGRFHVSQAYASAVLSLLHGGRDV